VVVRARGSRHFFLWAKRAKRRAFHIGALFLAKHAKQLNICCKWLKINDIYCLVPILICLVLLNKSRQTVFPISVREQLARGWGLGLSKKSGNPRHHGFVVVREQN
jgi:hypothetical protein